MLDTTAADMPCGALPDDPAPPRPGTGHPSPGAEPDATAPGPHRTAGSRPAELLSCPPNDSDFDIDDCDEDEDLLPGAETDKPASYEAILDRLEGVILQPTATGRKTGSMVSRLDTIFASMRYNRPDLRMIESDPMLRILLGMKVNEIPDFTAEFCAAMGRLFEVLVAQIFSLTRPRLYGAQWKEDRERLIAMGEHPGKFKGDFKFGLKAIETKYRFASGQALSEQAKGAPMLRLLGYDPVILILRKDSPREKELALANKGWDLRTGEATIDYILRHTGIDFLQVLHDLAARPLVAARTREWRAAVRSQAEVNQCAAYINTPLERRGLLHDAIARNDDWLADIMARRKTLIDPAVVAARADALASEALARTAADPVAALLAAFGGLGSAARAAAVSQMIDQLTSLDRLELAALRG